MQNFGRPDRRQIASQLGRSTRVPRVTPAKVTLAPKVELRPVEWPVAESPVGSSRH
jgi:hypothetical protein